MSYRQITFEERYTLGLLKRQGLTPATIARLLGQHRSTISRELRRNRTTHDGAYQPQLAHCYARSQRSRSRRNRRFGPADWRLVTRCLKRLWSPEQIAGRLRAEGRLTISHETIYRYIWADKAAGGHTSTPTCGAPESNAENATAPTTVADGWPENGTSPRDPTRLRLAPGWDIGKSTRSSAPDKPPPVC